MCCFSVASPIGWFARLVTAFTPPVHVSATHIYARMVEPGIQVLAYGMNLDSKSEIAMMLPLPVVPNSGEDAVTFIDLAEHPRMFEELHELFQMAEPQAKSRSIGLSRGPAPQTLVVHKVGSFIASYVPTRADFARLDKRFRIPEVLFDAVPAYGDYGFAVFQLEAGKTTVHPMAMRFPTRAPEKLFFPTVHVHDGRFKKTAAFDHALYYQTPRCQPEPHEPGAFAVPISAFQGDQVAWLRPGKTYAELVAKELPMIRRELLRKLPNQDTWISS